MISSNCPAFESREATLGMDGGLRIQERHVRKPRTLERPDLPTRKKVLPTPDDFRVEKGGYVLGQPQREALHQLSP
jgi:hypothetical protein